MGTIIAVGGIMGLVLFTILPATIIAIVLLVIGFMTLKFITNTIVGAAGKRRVRPDPVPADGSTTAKFTTPGQARRRYDPFCCKCDDSGPAQMPEEFKKVRMNGVTTQDLMKQNAELRAAGNTFTLV